MSLNIECAFSSSSELLIDQIQRTQPVQGGPKK